MSNDETPDQEVVLVFTHRQVAALSIAATVGIMYMGLDAKEADGGLLGDELRKNAGLFADVAECIGVINDAMGNETSEGYADTVRRVRELGDAT